MFFDTNTQSFLRTESWGNIYLTGLVDGLSTEELAREIASYCNEPVSHIANDVSRFLAELDHVDAAKPPALDNSNIFSRARRLANIRCNYAGKKHCNGSTVTVGFDSEKLRDVFQSLTFDSLELTADRVCDVSVSNKQKGVIVTAIDKDSSESFSVYEGILVGYYMAVDMLAKRIDSLFIAHGGAVSQEGVTALFPALGFSGKSTLVASLGLNGYDVVHDDVVPVLQDGTVVSLGSMVKLREESWPVIQTLYPDIQNLPVIKSGGSQRVKLMQPERRSADNSGPFHCQVLILPRFNPDSNPQLEPIEPLEALYKLVESESLFKKPAKHEEIERICKWVGNKRCYMITYPHMRAGLSLVEEVFSIARDRAQ